MHSAVCGKYVCIYDIDEITSLRTNVDSLVTWISR